MKPRYVKPGEALAMASTRLLQDRKGFFWMFGGSSPPNERRGDVAIVYVRGELEHHETTWGAESYEGILEKMRAAYAGTDAVEAHEREHRYEEDYQPIEAAPPKAVALVIDSPGGVVSGLTACVEELQRMRAEHPEIKVSCFVDEMATSAAYALACSCDEIVCPPSAILGSIGVIATMISATAADKKAGYDVRLITSGARKADGHLHAPMTDAAVQAETSRVDKLALAFFRLAGKARKLSVDKIRSFQAGIFLGKDAIRVGLADRLAPIDAILAPDAPEKSMDLAAQIKKTKAALASTDDPKELRELSAALGAYSAALEAYKKTEKFTEKVKTEEGADEGDEGDEDDEDKDTDEDEKSEGGEDEKKASTAAESDDEDDEAKSASKALALVQKLTGMKGKEALGALQAIAMTADNTAKEVSQLRSEGIARDKAALIAGAKGKHLTAKEATWLASQKMETVKGFVEMRRKSGVIVHTDESTILQPKASKPGSVEALPQFTRDMIDAAVASATGDKAKVRAELEAAHLKAHNEQVARALNGATEGRY